jgi:hypothetical protein
MTRLVLFLGLVCPLVVFGQAQPLIRAKLSPGNHVTVGQPVRLGVEVLVPNYFTGAPEYPTFEMDGAIVALSEDRPEHLNELIKGTVYAGIRRFYLIYPEQPGTFDVPPIEIIVPYAASPPATTRANLHLPSLSFRAVLPQEARDLDYFLPTSHLRIQQKWTGSLNDLHVGDSLTRTIVVTAQKMPAMLIPPAKLSAPDGVRVYPKDPSVENQESELGEFIQGVRTDRASYLFTKAGDYTLPEIAVTWWDLAAQKLKISKLPPAEIHVDVASAYVSELPPGQEPPRSAEAPRSRNWRQYRSVLGRAILALAILVIATWTIRRWGKRAVSHYRALLDRRHESETAYWRRLRHALHRNDAAQSYALLLAWVRRSRGVALEAFQSEAADPVLDQEISRLSVALFGKYKNEMWQGAELCGALSRHVKKSMQTKRPTSGLPALNPG